MLFAPALVIVGSNDFDNCFFRQSFENYYLLEMYQSLDFFCFVFIFSCSMNRLQRIDNLSPERSLNGPDLNSTPLSRQSSLQQELEAQEVCNMYTYASQCQWTQVSPN